MPPGPGVSPAPPNPTHNRSRDRHQHRPRPRRCPPRRPRVRRGGRELTVMTNQTTETGGQSWRTLGARCCACPSSCRYVLLGTVALWAVFADLRFDEGHTYFARFVNVSNMKKDSHVRIAGVEVGQVKNVSINRDSTVTVEFTADSSVVLTEGSRAVIRYDNVVGDRSRRRGCCRRHQEAQRRRTPPSSTAPSPRWTRCRHRRLPAVVLCPEPRQDQRSQWAADPGAARAGPSIPGRSRRRPRW